MSERHSVLERRDLYCPAPILSGQASYGELLKVVLLISAGTLVLSLLLTMITMGFLRVGGVDGSLAWMWFIPAIITFLIAVWLLRWTRKRRDILVVLKESLEIEKSELRS